MRLFFLLGFFLTASGVLAPAAETPAIRPATILVGDKYVAISLDQVGKRLLLRNAEFKRDVVVQLPEAAKGSQVSEVIACPWLRTHGLALCIETTDVSTGEKTYFLAVAFTSVTSFGVVSVKQFLETKDDYHLSAISNFDGDTVYTILADAKNSAPDSADGYVYCHRCTLSLELGGKLYPLMEPVKASR